MTDHFASPKDAATFAECRNDACPLCGRWNCDPTACPPGAARDQLALGRAHAAEGGGRR